MFLLNIASFAQNLNYPKTKIDWKEFYIYNVGAREGFYTLTRLFNISQQEIEKYNPETKAGLKIDQRLLIPVNPELPMNKSFDEEKEFNHTIEPGETLNSIARTYNVKPSEIQKLNPNLGPILTIGHSMKIPTPAINNTV